VDARSKIKQVSVVGRKGRAGQLALAVSFIPLDSVEKYEFRIVLVKSLLTLNQVNEIR
jgi:hypothetical protein